MGRDHHCGPGPLGMGRDRRARAGITIVGRDQRCGPGPPGAWHRLGPPGVGWDHRDRRAGTAECGPGPPGTGPGTPGAAGTAGTDRQHCLCLRVQRVRGCDRVLAIPVSVNSSNKQHGKVQRFREDNNHVKLFTSYFLVLFLFTRVTSNIIRDVYGITSTISTGMRTLDVGSTSGVGSMSGAWD